MIFGIYGLDKKRYHDQPVILPSTYKATKQQ